MQQFRHCIHREIARFAHLILGLGEQIIAALHLAEDSVQGLEAVSCGIGLFPGLLDGPGVVLRALCVLLYGGGEAGIFPRQGVNFRLIVRQRLFQDVKLLGRLIDTV